MNSIFADYSDDWFIPFMGDDVVAKCVCNLKKNKAAFDTQKGANLGQNAFGGRAPPGPAGELQRSPDPLAAIGKEWEKGRLLPDSVATAI